MKIREFHIDGFGRFTDRTVGPLDLPVTIFHGPNEAGKSTYLEFIRAILFGFPKRLGRRHYPPLAGGAHGGRATLVDEAGERYIVHRVQGRGAGPVTITDGAGETFGAATLARLLGHHSKDVFESVFAFTLDELHSDDLLKDSSVNDQIYSAGMGVTRLPNVRKALASQKSDLFLKGGRKHKLAQAAGEVARIDTRLAEVAGNASDYGALSAELEDVGTKLQALDARRREAESRLDGARRLKSAWGDWNDLLTARRQLDEIPVVEEFPVDGVSRLEGLEERVRTARQERDSAAARVTETRDRRVAQVAHESLLDHSLRIRRLVKRRESFEKSARDLPRREEELLGHRRSLSETLKDLGPDWDVARLEAFDLSLAVRQEISGFRTEFRGAGEELARRQSSRAQAENARDEASDASDRAEQALEEAPDPGLDADGVRLRRTRIRQARARLDELARVRQRVSDLQSQLDGIGASAAPTERQRGAGAAAAIGIAGVALLVGGAAAGGAALFIGAAAGLLLLAVAAYVFRSAALSSGLDPGGPLADSIGESLRRAEADLNELESKAADDAGGLDLETLDEHSLIQAEESLDATESGVRERARIAESLDAARDTLHRRSVQSSRSRTAVERAERDLETVRRRWREWLQARRLPQSFTPDTVGELRERIKLGLSLLGELRKQEQRFRVLEKEIREYTESVEPLASAFEIGFDANRPPAVAAAADRLIELHESVREQVDVREAAEAEWKAAERKLEERNRRLRDAEEELAGLLHSGGGGGAEEFRRRAELHRRREELKRSRQDAEGRLQRRSGPGELLEALKNALRNTDLQSIADEKSRTLAEIERIDADLKELSTERGSLRAKLERLESEEESSRLRMERNRLVEQIRDHAREWTKRRIVERLLEEAQSRFERERQPGVVRQAEDFFRRITGGEYRRVSAPLGRKTIEVAGADRRAKEPSQLSRGTREQLFLSLRFGLIRELGKRTEPLPVVVDEVLVNFDPDRGLQAAHAFVELSRTNQVLVFTCHPFVVEFFQAAAAGSEERILSVVDFE